MTEGVGDKKSAEMRLLYQDCLDNIRDLKKLQWAIVNYALLLDAALIGLLALIKGEYFASPGHLEWSASVILNCVIFVSACVLVVHCQVKMANWRRRLHFIRDNHFDESIYLLPDAEKRFHKEVWYNWPLWVFLLGVVLAGFLVTWYMIDLRLGL